MEKEKRREEKKWIEQAIFFEEGSDKFQGWRGNFKIDENNRELVNQSRENEYFLGNILQALISNFLIYETNFRSVQTK